MSLLLRGIQGSLGYPLLTENAPSLDDSLEQLAQTPAFVEVNYQLVLRHLHNLYRRGPLVLVMRLCEAAQEHADSMARRRRLDHLGFGERAGRYGIRAENAAWGHTSPDQCWYHRTAGWYSSAGHRRNALNPAYGSVGFGRNGVYWVAVYA